MNYKRITQVGTALAVAGALCTPGARAEANDSPHTVAHLTYPFKFVSGQFLEVGVDAYTGRFKIGSGEITVDGVSFTPDAPGGFKDERIATHFILYPQPFGLQGEWTVGRNSTSANSASACNRSAAATSRRWSRSTAASAR